MVSRTETVTSLAQRTGKPRLYKDGERKGVLVFPGATQDRHWWFDLNLVTHELRQITEDYGFPVASMGTLATWGNSTFRTNASQLKTNAQTALFASGKVHLLGVSAGGLGALNWAKNNPTLVQSIVLLIPVINPQGVYDENRGSFQSVVSTAYGGSPPDADTPATYAADLDGIPIRMFYSTTDTITTQSESETFISDSGAEGVSMGAVGHFWGSPWNGLAAAEFMFAND